MNDDEQTVDSTSAEEATAEEQDSASGADVQPAEAAEGAENVPAEPAEGESAEGDDVEEAPAA